MIGIILEIIITVVVFGIIFWFIIKLIEGRKIKKLRRRYKEEDDPGKKLTPEKEIGLGFRTTGRTNKREPILQDALVNVKRELLSSGDSGGNNGSSKSITKPKRNPRKVKRNPRRKTKRPQ